ncbi:hypothetical protein EGW08_022476 [Elysia chlorotica]|uniref:Ubiquitin-like domain-containing protein n=1 Tax=Elysia chlorotica TaxID=188477 RepID=A0A3S1B1P1_ELYCH|nr:hypothetical protein EGW08_022476 [Elysia chlorotica]
MSAAASSAILLESGSEEEFDPSPPKRGRGRPRRTRRAAARAVRSNQTRASVTRSRTRASGPNRNATVISVGDIDSDEEDAPRAVSPVTVHAPRSVSPIALDTLAQVLGVSDWTPSKISEPESVLSPDKETPTENGTDSHTMSEPTDITLGANSISSSHSDLKAPSQTSSEINSLAGPTLENISNQVSCNAPVSGPKRTARRGLAKRNAGLSTTALEGFNSDLPDTAVYSQRVPSATSSILYPKKTQSEDFTSTSETQSESENFSGAETAKPEPAGALSRKSSSSDTNKLYHDSEEIEEGDKTIIEVQEGKEEDNSILEIRSPSPPPQISGKRKVTAQRKKLNQKLSNALQTINNVKGKLEKLGKTTPKSKTRGKRQDIAFMGEEEGIVKDEMVIKVRYLSTVHRISMNLNDTLHSLTGKLSKLLGDVEEHELSLFLNDQLLDLSLTVRAANLSVADIINCHHFKTADISGEADLAGDNINLVVQCRHSRSKTTITAHKRQPLKHVIERYAKTMGLDAGSVRLVFDGEDVNPLDTPYKLDIEDMDVVDVVVIVENSFGRF